MYWGSPVLNNFKYGDCYLPIYSIVIEIVLRIVVRFCLKSKNHGAEFHRKFKKRS